MEENEILNLVISRMTEEGMWFTTKNDPTFAEAPSYYEKKWPGSHYLQRAQF